MSDKSGPAGLRATAIGEGRIRVDLFVIEVHEKQTKLGDRWALVDAHSAIGDVRVAVWPKLYPTVERYLHAGCLINVTGRLRPSRSSAVPGSGRDLEAQSVESIDAL